MKLRATKWKLKDFPVYEHLEYGIKCNYRESLQWLEEANKFIWELRRNPNWPHWDKKK